MSDNDQPAKRARANSAGHSHMRPAEASVISTADAAELARIRAMVEDLSRKDVNILLTHAAKTQPRILTSITRRVHEKARNVISFDHYSSSIWKSLNITYRSLSGSHQYDRAGDVSNEIDSTIQTILSQCGPFAHPQTRWNGLSVLRKFGKTIALSGRDTLDHEVQKYYQYNTTLEDAMLSIIEAMTPAEKQKVREDEHEPDGLWLKLLELEQLGKHEMLFEKLGEVVDLLELTHGSEAQEENEGNEEDEEEEEDDRDSTEDETGEE